MGYTKLFSDIITSTIWTEDDKTRILWITMLALANRHGEVMASIPGLARLAGTEIKDAEIAIKKFKSPDEHSRTKTDKGRRIEDIEGGWILLNYEDYRKRASIEDMKEKNRMRQQKWKEHQAKNGHKST